MTVDRGPACGGVRAIRAGFLASVAVGVAELAHAGTDGCGSLVALLLAFGLTWPAAVAMLGARRQVPALVGWLLATQLVLHVLLESRCDEVLSGRQGLLDHLAAVPAGRALLAHGLAVLVSAVLLGRADAGVWAADMLRRAVRPVVRLGVVVVPAQRTQVPVAVVLPARDTWKGRRPSRRGPPALLAP